MIQDKDVSLRYLLNECTCDVLTFFEGIVDNFSFFSYFSQYFLVKSIALFYV